METVSFSRSAGQRIADVVRRVEATPINALLPEEPWLDDRLHRFFRLTAELSGGKGATAAVKWLNWNEPDVDFIEDPGRSPNWGVGEVYDAFGNCYGLIGEKGEAMLVGSRWIVTRNPGSAVYQGQAYPDDITGSTGAFQVTLPGESPQSVTCTIPSGAIPAGKQITANDYALISNFAGTFYVVALTQCLDDT